MSHGGRELVPAAPRLEDTQWKCGVFCVYGCVSCVWGILFVQEGVLILKKQKTRSKENNTFLAK